MAIPISDPSNWSIKAIPAAFVFGIVPHGWYLTRLMIATKGQMSNSMPRTNLDAWKNRLPADLWNHLARSRGAHINSMEVFPLFAAAMLAGNAAGLPAQEMNSAAWSFFAARTVYMGVYMAVKSDTLAVARTGAWAWSISIPIMMLWKAGQTIA